MASPEARQSRRLRGLSPEPSPRPVRRRRIGGPSGDNLVEADTSIDSPATPFAGEALDHLVGHPLGIVCESHSEEEQTALDSSLLNRVTVEDLRDTSVDPVNPPLTDPRGPALVHISDPLFFSAMSRPPATSSVGGTGSAFVQTSIPSSSTTVMSSQANLGSTSSIPGTSVPFTTFTSSIPTIPVTWGVTPPQNTTFQFGSTSSGATSTSQGVGSSQPFHTPPSGGGNPHGGGYVPPLFNQMGGSHFSGFGFPNPSIFQTPPSGSQYSQWPGGNSNNAFGTGSQGFFPHPPQATTNLPFLETLNLLDLENLPTIPSGTVDSSLRYLLSYPRIFLNSREKLEKILSTIS